MDLAQMFDAMFVRMLQAGWLLRYTLTDGKGWHLEWLERGSLGSLRIKRIATDLGLDEADDCAALFHVLANGLRLPAIAGSPIGRAFCAELVQAGYAQRHLGVGDVSEGQMTLKGAAAIADYLEACDQLGLGPDAALDDVLCLIHVCVGWAPGPDSKVGFLRPK